MRVRLATEDGLDAFSTYSPAVVKVAVDGILIEQEFAQALQRRLDADDHMPHRNTHIAEHGGVGQVSLQAADRQFLTQESKDGVCHTKVALRVLEVDRIHLMRHCRRTHFASLDFLLEIFHRHIHPEVSVEVDDDGVDALHGIEDGTHVVVVADLGGPLFAFQTEFLAHELIAKRLPVILGISNVVGVVVACGTAKLGCHLASLQLVQLLGQTIDIHHHLLAQTSGRSGLSMCLCQHGDVFPLISILFELCNEFLHLRVIDFCQRLLDGERHRCIVDVLTGQSKVNKFLDS